MYLYIKPYSTFGPWGHIGNNSANLQKNGLSELTADSDGTDFSLASYSTSGSYNDNGDAPSFSVTWAFNVNSSWGGFANSPHGKFTATGSSIGAIRYWNDVNVYNPAGSQDYLSGYFDLYTSENNSWRYNLLNEDDDMTHAKGTYFQVQNIRPYYSYYQLSSVSGHDSTPSSGAYRKTFDAASEVLAIYMSYVSYYLDLNGRLDGSDSGNISGYGTCDVTVGGTLRSGDCTDYYTAWPYGTSYSISDIRATTGHSYAGSVGAATSGTITGATDVRLSFTTNTYTNYCQCWTWGYKNGEGNNGGKTAFHIGDTSWSAKYGTSVQWTAAKAKASPNGFTMRNSIGSSSHSGSWTGYNLPYTFTQPASNCYAEYDYDPVNYSITYTMNGGTNSSSNPSSYNVLYGVTFANPTRSGYDFKGWTIGGTKVTGINPGANASFSSPDDLYNKCASRTTGNKTVVANWLETKPSNVRITSYNVTGPFGIDLSWSATGVNISNYTVYYRPTGTSTWLTKNAGTATSTSLTVSEETTYEFFVRATNPGGTGDSSTTTATTPADQAKIRIKKGLPAGYERLNYIEATGTQYIDTGITMKTSTTIDCRFEVVDRVNDYLFGQEQNSGNMMYSGLYNASVYEYGWNAYSFPAADFIYMTQRIDGNTLITNINNSSFSMPVNTTLPTYTTKIFRCNDNRHYNGKARIFFFVIKENGNPVIELYPCRRTSDSAIGMYDIVGNKFYPNLGTGTFGYGTITDWIKGKTYYKKDGQWVKAKKIYIKVNGQWKIGTNYD
jgi:uncharacterized repeat protein (TIGR02543 family)